MKAVAQSRYFLVFVSVFLGFGGQVSAAQYEKQNPAPAAEAATTNMSAQNGLRKDAILPNQTPIIPVTPIISLPRTWPALVVEAGPYARFLDVVQRATYITPTSAEDLERMMSDLASFDGPKLSRSFHAYAVLQAMQAPAFFEGLQHWGRIYDRKTIIKNLHINPAYVEQMPQYAQAKERVLRTIKDGGQKTQKAGGIYKSLAYTLQKQKWASKVRRGKALRLAALRNAPYARRGTSENLLEPLMQAYHPQPPRTPVGMAANMALAAISTDTNVLPNLTQNIATISILPPPPLEAYPSHRGQLQDILASAALHILDHNAPYPSALPPRNTPDTLAECVDWARLHLDQCVAATRYVFEDSFCISRHQLSDSGRCIAEFLDGPQVVTH